MNHIDLGSPSKRAIELPFTAFTYDTISCDYLPVPDKLPPINFSDVLHSRCSRRDFGPLSEQQLSAFLWYSSKTISVRLEESGYLWEHRPAPSAGGRHPLDLLVTNYGEMKSDFYLYDPFSHALRRTRTDQEQTVPLSHEITKIIPLGSGVIIWHVAQFVKTLSKYSSGESLVWRDAGALLGIKSLVAEALRLKFCGIGITGEPWLSTMLRSNGKVVGVGGCLIGS